MHKQVVDQIVPEGTSAVSGSVKESVQERPWAKEKIDPIKLVLYSEIMKPKF